MELVTNDNKKDIICKHSKRKVIDDEIKIIICGIEYSINKLRTIPDDEFDKIWTQFCENFTSEVQFSERIVNSQLSSVLPYAPTTGWIYSEITSLYAILYTLKVERKINKLLGHS